MAGGFELRAAELAAIAQGGFEQAQAALLVERKAARRLGEQGVPEIERDRPYHHASPRSQGVRLHRLNI